LSQVVCVFCLAPESRVLDSRWSERFQGMRRRRVCPECQRRWSTVEVDRDQLTQLQELVATLTLKVHVLNRRLSDYEDTPPTPDPD
jgi:transcriptional regulator NrdR family protein